MTTGSLATSFLLFLAFWWSPAEAQWWRKADSGMNREIRRMILAYHNNARILEGGSNMNRMIWDFGLEVQTARWTRQCRYQHRKNGPTGENLAMATGKAALEEKVTGAMKGWYDERKLLIYLKPTAYHAGFHYTQMVWARTYRVGCAVKQCDLLHGLYGKKYKNAWFFACFYTPKGNLVNAPAYIEGPACSTCNPGQRCLWRACTGKGGPFCDNVIPHCKPLAKFTDKCKSDPDFMKEHCAKACGYCKAPPKACVDISHRCRVLVAAYGCNEPSNEVKRACPKSCGICNPDSKLKPQVVGREYTLIVQPSPKQEEDTITGPVEHLLVIILGFLESSVKMSDVHTKGEFGQGRIQMTFHYSPQRQTLIIVVHKCVNLLPLDSNNLSDPYVRMFLLPEKSSSSKRKTQVIKDTLNPVFDETFEYPLSTSELGNRSLEICVKNEVPVFSSSKKIMGVVNLDLTNLDVSEAITEWFDLRPEDNTEQTSLVKSDV